MKTYVSPDGTARLTLTAGDTLIMAASGNDAAQVFVKTAPGTSNPGGYYLATSIINSTATIGPYESDREVRIETGACTAYYDSGASPVLALGEGLPINLGNDVYVFACDGVPDPGPYGAASLALDYTNAVIRFNTGTAEAPVWATVNVTAPVVSCALPLGATEGEVISFGFNGRLTLSGSDQTGTLTTDGTDRQLAAFPTNPTTTPATFSIATGKKVIEWLFTVPAIEISTGDGPITMDTRMFPAGGPGQPFHVNVTRNSADVGSVQLTVERTGSPVFEDLLFPLVGTELVVGIEMNADAGTFRVIANGDALTLTDGTFTPPSEELVHVMAVREQFMTGVNLGLAYSIAARTSAADITQTYGASATDLCGNAL